LLLDVPGTSQGLNKINNEAAPTSADTPAGPGDPLQGVAPCPNLRLHAWPVAS
jgi:hypothetical protein